MTPFSVKSFIDFGHAMTTLFGATKRRIFSSSWLFSQIYFVVMSASASASASALTSASTTSCLQIATRFILVQTNHNGNVGAAARAMKTMGFDDLVLVEPRDPKVLRRDKTKHGASGADNILSNAKVYASLEEALDGVDIACATGMPVNMALDRPEQHFQPPRQYFSKMLSTATNQHKEDSSIVSSALPLPLNRIAFLFGNERVGLRPEDFDECDVVLGIPTNPEFGSLNVASAVQLIAYDWREAIGSYSTDMLKDSRDHRL